MDHKTYIKERRAAQLKRDRRRSCKAASWKIPPIGFKTLKLPILDISELEYVIQEDFTVCRSNKQKIHDIFSNIVLQTIGEERETTIDPIEPFPSPPGRPYRRQRALAHLCRPMYMDRNTERECIARLACFDLVDAWPEAYKDVLEEVHHDWTLTHHFAGINERILIPDHEWTYKIEHFKPYQYLGKTPRYKETFIKPKQALEENLFIFSSLHLKVFHDALNKVPDILFAMDNLRDTDYVLNDLFHILLKRVEKADEKIRMWYRFAVRDYVKPDLFKEVYPEEKWESYLRSITVLMSIIMSNVIRRTMAHMVNVLSSSKHVPFIRINLEYEEEYWKIFPPHREVAEMYCVLLEKLSDSARELPCIEFYHMTGFTHKLLPIYIDKPYIEYCWKLIKNHVYNAYKPIYKYKRMLIRRFGDIFDIVELKRQESVRISLVDDHVTDITFEEGFTKVDNFVRRRTQIYHMTEHVYFKLGKMTQSNVKRILLIYVRILMDEILNKLKLMHMWVNQEIYAAFVMLKIRALKEPKTTEELIELTEYMAWVTTEYLEVLFDRVRYSIWAYNTMVDNTELTRNHIALNTRTYNWVFLIVPVLEDSLAMIETYRALYEQRLARTIKKLNRDLIAFMPLLPMLDDMDNSSLSREYMKHVNFFLVRIRRFTETAKWINKEETNFKFPLTTYPLIGELKDYVYPFFKVMKLCANWLRYRYAWLDGKMESVIPEKCEDVVDYLLRELTKMEKSYRALIRLQIHDAVARRFKGVLDDPEFVNQPSPVKLCHKTILQLKEFRPILDVIGIVCNDALLQRHWDEMSSYVGFDVTPDASFTLRRYIQRGFNGKLDMMEIVSQGAVKERSLLRALLKMQEEWKSIYFKTTLYKDTDVTILTQLDDIMTTLDDHILKTLTMRGSVFVEPYEKEVIEWYEKLVRVNATVDEWGKVQSQWLYLLPIFSSPDIVSQMNKEERLFREVDTIYRNYMNAAAKDPLVMNTAPIPGLLENMQKCTKLLDKINEGVTSYLEKKRLYFPRFFFLSNDEMLEILSETQNPLRVQPHLKKCFEGIYRLNFDDKLFILAMKSQETEEVSFVNTIDTLAAGGSVEKWLIQVEEQMILGIKATLYRSYESFIKHHRINWLSRWPGQIVLAVSQIYWTMNVHACLSGDPDPEPEFTLTRYLKKCLSELNAIVSRVRDPELKNLERISIKALIVIDVHAKDVVQDLIEKDVTRDTEFKWLAQLRYYWDNDCLVRMINATVRYAYEYLGNTDRLVITPLTDRCYRTLIGAYHLHLNGAPEGPAGTGKTETTKDLAKALAVQCVVFNCSDGLDYKAMGKFFKGLASCGAWACFDEFNRIELEVLSVVAQQILCIVLAVRAGVEKFMFEGTELRLNPAVYVCITMNPGYAGRSELPDNLKVLFRTVAMMVPDYAMIGEISLYSFGFIDARNLSVKIVTTYKLCSEQLSSQNHYDYGMRAVKSVLSAAGNLKRDFPDEREDVLLLRSITDVNLPKFLSHDVPLFQGIISDLFPETQLPIADYEIFITEIKQCCQQKKLQAEEAFIAKIIQTYEMMIVRHGFMLVGEPFAGKTSTLQVLADVMSNLATMGFSYQKTEYQIINPKSITMGQLYGFFDPVSYEWTDGVVANGFRLFAQQDTYDRKWLIFDGPVDAVWIENMNTVLDDNKKLCLNSGEVITMTNEMSMIFEAMDLSQASPATVSRCGMIYMEPQSLGWKPFVQSWLDSSDPSWDDHFKLFIMVHFDWLVPPCIEYVRKHCKEFVSAGDINLIITTLQIIKMLMTDATILHRVDYPHEEIKYLPVWFEASFMIAAVWGLGGILDHASREKFDIFFKNLWNGNDPKYPVPEVVIERQEIELPEVAIFDSFYSYTLKGAWKNFPEVLEYQKINEHQNIYHAIIPTLDTLRYEYMLLLFIRHGLRTLLVGPTGTGKSFYTQNLLMHHVEAEVFEPGFITFTVKISANQCQDLIISKLYKRKRGNYGPTKGKQCVIFIDDLNMPVKEQYGAQPPIELLRQFFDHGNWYDLKDTKPILLHDIQFLAAMGLVGGSRQDVYARFLRHFAIFSINNFNESTMERIYCNILFIGLKQKGFPSEILTVAQHIVKATLNMYDAAEIGLRPTPAKSHYIFNLRDFSRIIFGMTMMRKEVAGDDKTIFVRLWVHEILRVYYDRITDDTDHTWVFNQIKHTVKSDFRENFDGVFERFQNEKKIVKEESLCDLWFGTYLDLNNDLEDKRYEEIIDVEQFKDIALQFLAEYNSLNKQKMDIVLFRYALKHLSRLLRVLSMPRGSALLIGISGSGRQSLARLGTQIMGHTKFQVEIGKHYGMNEWREDIKKVLRETGGRGRHSTFIFSEEQILEEGFLQDIDCLLNSGEVPNIYPIEERQEILDMVRLAAQGGNRNLDVSALQVFSYFIKRSHEKLHIVLCFSPIGASFRNRLRMYPTFVNCCTIDWYEDWPEEALKLTAQQWIKDVNLSEDLKLASAIACQRFHLVAREIAQHFYDDTGRKSYITSASYLELIKSYTQLINTKQVEIMASKFRYINGLEKLDVTAQQVSKMQIDLQALQPQLKQMNAKAVAMTNEIERETIEAEKASELVKKDEEAANVQAAAAQALKAECEGDLALAIPILEEALAALNTLKPHDITLVKSMKNPPDTVKLVMAAVCVMKGVKPDRTIDPNTGKKILDYWPPSKRILGEMSFLQQLKEFDKDHIKMDVIHKIRKEFLPHKDFKPKIVAKASSAAEGLCKWIIAMTRYDTVAREVAPKKAKLEVAEQEFNATKAVLAAKRELVKKLEEKVAKLNEQLAVAQEEQGQLQDHVDLCELKLTRAKKLISGLGGEKTRWTESAKKLQTQYDKLAGDIIICCGIIAYLSPYTVKYRAAAVKDWKEYIKKLKLPASNKFNFVEILGDDVTIQNWYIAGLPRDLFSTENAIICRASRRFSLFIDPQNQANHWIKTMENDNELSIIKFTDKNYMKVLEKSMEFGTPCLLESVLEELDAPLDPLLNKCIFTQGHHTYLKMGDNVVLYSENFRLYITTTLRNPHYLPEVFNKVTIINFALTLEGLEDQLLGIVVSRERPDLQMERESLIVECAENKAALNETEETILQTLAESKGDILEDEDAIEILDRSKTLALTISKKQTIAIKTTKKIEASRQDYQPCAAHSAILYYCISDLPNVDPMYQYSLAWFINLFHSAITTAAKAKELYLRIEYLIDAFNYCIYINVCRSLFEKDKLMFSFILCCKILIFQKKLNDDELTFFLTGGIPVKNIYTNPATSWMSDRVWDEICRVSDLPAFKGFSKSVASNTGAWRMFYDATEPEYREATMDPFWAKKLSAFQKLMLIRIFRPDKITTGTRIFVEKEMGERFVTPPPFDISKSFDESTSTCPLIFILSPGADPMAQLVKFAERKGFLNRFETISLGQGQGPIAEKIIREAMQVGQWVCLQNCHLAVSWMPSLEKIWERIDKSNTSGNFRMWLTSYPSDRFPISILQYGVKMTNEAPTGLQQNLLRSYLNEPVREPDFYRGCPGKESPFTRLLYGLAFFHAVVQERRTFGPLGWNIPYGFNESDFDISINQLKMFINEYADIPFEAITYLTGECNYGGRVTDDWDRRLIVTILEDFVNQDLIDDPSYQFVPHGSTWYNIPVDTTNYEAVVKHIEELPAVHNPVVFGLHPNAGITRDLQDSNMLLESMILFEGGVIASSSGHSDNVILAVTTDILTKLPPNFNTELAVQKYPVTYSESMNTVLVQEMVRFNRLLTEIRSSLNNVQKAVNGIVVMSPTLELVCSSLLLGRIPATWMKCSYPSLKTLPDYIEDFVKRLDFLQHWYLHGKPSTFWLSGFYFTQAFLTGAKQNYARKYKIPIDQLTFDFDIKAVDQLSVSPEDGVYVNGLFVDGARWDRTLEILAEQIPKVLWDIMPCIWVRPILNMDYYEGERYKSPLYKTSERRGVLSTTGHSTNYVIPILLPSMDPVNHWIKRSVALLCQLN